MAKTIPRLYVSANLAPQMALNLAPAQAHYVAGVLRARLGDPVRIFNAQNGEWLSHITELTRKTVRLQCEQQLAAVKPPPDIDYLFAPLKHARLDYMVQKATELGVRRLRPVITQRTIAERINLERMRTNVIEAAEQCNLVYLPEVLEAEKLPQILQNWESERILIFCDETAAVQNPLLSLGKLKAPAAVMIGPEGGFTEQEKMHLTAQSFVKPLSLGPRILRADTAAVAALTLVMAHAGDWGDMANQGGG